MIALVPDLRLIKPNAKTLYVTCSIAGRERVGYYKMKVLGNNISKFNLSFLPISVELVEVYLNGRRILDGYSIAGRIITFTAPVSGRIDIICDYSDPTYMEWCEIPFKNMIAYDSLVDAAYGTDRRDGPNILQRCVPIVIVQPTAGFCRTNIYRDTLLYCPIKGYEGPDSITYALLNDSGQLSEPKCINITVQIPPPVVTIPAAV
jgi:hypothetical protein